MLGGSDIGGRPGRCIPPIGTAPGGGSIGLKPGAMGGIPGRGIEPGGIPKGGG